MSNRVLSRHLEPARSVLVTIGSHADPGLVCDGKRMTKGIEVAAAVTGRTEATIYRWMYPRERGGTDGMVPQADQHLLLQWSQQRRAALVAAHFFPADLIKQARKQRPKRTRGTKTQFSLRADG